LIIAKGTLGVLCFVEFLIENCNADILSTATTAKLGNLCDLTEFGEFVDNFLLLEISQSLGTTSVGRKSTFAIADASDTRKDTCALDTLSKAS